jgi:hypothetical protein
MRRKTSEINNMHDIFDIRKALSLNHALNDMLEAHNCKETDSPIEMH